MPWEITPAFFRPEVLLRYKADRDKYTLLERSVSCRGAWYLETFDVNDAGQVHTYLIYLSRLPYEEQLHWRAHNEAPKGPMSERAIKGDINGEFYDEFNPLQSLKQKLSDMRRQHVPWWTLRATYLMDRSNYPFTPSTEEWADEILTLDQLVVEGFEETWLRRKAIELRRSPAANLRSLKLVEECLVGLGLEAQDAAAIVSPLHQLHGLRNKLKGHVTGKDAASIKSDALATYGTFRKHFIHLADECDQAIGTIFQLFSEDGRLRQ